MCLKTIAKYLLLFITVKNNRRHFNGSSLAATTLRQSTLSARPDRTSGSSALPHPSCVVRCFRYRVCVQWRRKCFNSFAFYLITHLLWVEKKYCSACPFDCCSESRFDTIGFLAAIKYKSITETTVDKSVGGER